MTGIVDIALPYQREFISNPAKRKMWISSDFKLIVLEKDGHRVC